MPNPLIALITTIVCLLDFAVCTDFSGDLSGITYRALINVTIFDHVTGVSYRKLEGTYGHNSRRDTEWGLLVHTRTADSKNHGCSHPVNIPPKEKWIALIQRGVCKYFDKVFNAAIERNASAVIVYNNIDHDDGIYQINHDVLKIDLVPNVVAISISKAYGLQLASLIDNGTRVYVNISAGDIIHGPYLGINRTSVLFVSISFIVLMIISLAWLVFYYIQRFRYAHAKERLSKRLMNAAKKAITKMPVRTVKNGDQETDADFDQCAVCIEPYKASEVIRILPCKHVFHKSCVDPWLVEQRSCPMCKLDILKAYGMQVHDSKENVMELEAASTSLYPPSEPPESIVQIETVGRVHFADRQTDRHDQIRHVDSVASEDDEANELQSLMTEATPQPAA